MIGIVGAGAFGTALSVVQASAGRAVSLWARDGAAIARMRESRENAARLPGVALPPEVECVDGLAALEGADALLLALPAQVTGAFLAGNRAALPDGPLVLCAKGLGRERFRLQSAIAAEECPDRPLAVLTGPGFAGEIARGLPTALTLASADAGLARDLQGLLSTPRMRLYATDDVTGAQIGGALKNVTAIACGMSDGARLGHSARAALMTRGFAEMTRLAVAMGARAETLAGLSGLGDLSLTCNSAQSRNFALGLALGSGRKPSAGTVEGVATARAACQLAATLGVDMPIAAAVADVLDGTMTMREAMDALLSRPLKEE